jgi:hypothetical protein
VKVTLQMKRGKMKIPYFVLKSLYVKWHTCCHTHCDDRDSCHNPRTTSNKPEKSTEYNTDQMHNKNLKLIKNGNKI